MKSFVLAIRQIKYENLAFWRNPVAAFFTFVFPLMFLAIFNLLFGNHPIEVPGGTTHTSTFYVPAIIALSVISACYTNVAIGMSMSRDLGILKRIRGTPLPPWAFLFGRIATSILISIILVIIVTAAGIIFYSVDVPTNTIPALVLTLCLGAATFCSLGIAITAAIPNSEASPAIVNASVLPLMFISDVFMPMHDAPGWLNTFAEIFPIKRFSSALQASFNPFETGLGFEPVDLFVMFGWMVLGLIIAKKYFSWEPHQ